MKRNALLKIMPALASALILTAGLVSCGWPFSNAKASSGGALSVQASLSADLARFVGGNASRGAAPSGARTVLPIGVDFGSLTYTATLSNAGVPDSPHTDTSGTGSFSFASVSPGQWTLEVSAVSGATTVAFGTSTVTISTGIPASANVILGPPTGTGSVSIPLTYTGSRTFSPTVALAPINVPLGGSAIDLSSSGDLSTTPFASASVPSGIWALSASLRTPAATENSWSTTDVVYVLPGATSTAAGWTLTDADMLGIVGDFTSYGISWVYNPLTSLYDRILVSWFGATNADSYRIEREQSVDNATWTNHVDLVTVTGADAWGWVDATVVTNLFYRYFLTATNARGTTALSTWMAIGPPEASPTISINAPRNVTIGLTVAGTLYKGVHGLASVEPQCLNSGGLISPSLAQWRVNGVDGSGGAFAGTPGVTYDTARLFLDTAAMALGTYVVDYEILYAGYYYANRFQTTLAIQPGTLKWSRAFLTPFYPEIAIALDGTLYLSEGRQYLCAINPWNGNDYWVYTAPSGYFYSSPAVATDGTIYIGTDDNYLYAINPDGSLKWRHALSAGGGGVNGCPAIATDGTIYAHGGNMMLTALSPDGTERWNVDYGMTGSPAIATDGLIIMGSPSGFLHGLDPGDGSEAWSFDLGGSCASPSIAADGTIYTGGTSLYARHADGTLAWSTALGGTTASNPVLSTEGTIYVGDFNGGLNAFNAAGSPLWTYSTGAAIRGSAAVAADGTIYVYSDDMLLHAMDADGNPMWTFPVGDDNTSGTSPIIGADGTVYVGAMDTGILYAVYGSAGPDDSAWPLFHKNMRRSGNAAD